ERIRQSDAANAVLAVDPDVLREAGRAGEVDQTLHALLRGRPLGRGHELRVAAEVDLRAVVRGLGAAHRVGADLRHVARHRPELIERLPRITAAELRELVDVDPELLAELR